MSTLTFGPHTVETSNEDKVLFPGDGITKGELIDYYRRIADRMVPYLAGRPLTLHRYPDGIGADGFYQQEAGDYFPDFVERVEVEKEGGVVHHAVCNDQATLVYLANQAVVTPHTWLSRSDDLHHPDRLVFDFDPSDDDFGMVMHGARALHDLFGDVDMPAYVMTSGSRGLHVYVPLDRSATFDTARAFARNVAEVLAARHPDVLTTAQRKDKRQGRVFVDYLRNAYGQTSVPPYAVRARPGAPVATPLDWDEVAGSGLGPRKYTLRNLFRRLGQKEDPWEGMARHGVSIDKAQEKLDALHAAEAS